MAHAEITFGTGGAEGTVFEHAVFDGPEAIDTGYKHFMDLIKERADWLLHASVQRDFDDNLTAYVTVRIGPMPYWGENPPWPTWRDQQ